MKTLILFFAYVTLSVLAGLVTCGIALSRKRQRAALVCALIFFGGPLAVFAWIEIQSRSGLKDFESARAEVQELCAKYGGDKIYKTVDNVEGIFQMKARNPSGEDQWRDQYGMVDPWGAAQGDGHKMDGLLTNQASESIAGYIFVEQQPMFGKPDGPPYRRFYLRPTGKKIGDVHPYAPNRDKPELRVMDEQTQVLASRYGYAIEDLSTREMRRNWIAGGKIKIIDLQTQEVLAERIGYFRAAASGNYPWSSAGVYLTNHMCPNDSTLGEFLRKVLKPVSYQPIPNYSAFQPR